MKKVFAIAVLMFASCGLSMAWNCTGNDIRVQVATGTIGTGTGDAPGNVVVDNGLTFQCQTPPSTNPSTGSTSTSSSTATGGNSSSSATGGKATSTSGVSNSGNSTNTLSNTQGQKQKQSQTQSNTSTNSNESAGGSVSNVGNSVTNVAAPDIPVNSAYAPPVFSSVNCFKGWSAGGQTPLIGGSFGGGGVDRNCVAERIAQDYYAMGNRLAACKVITSTKASKDAHVTLEDCMNVPVRPIVVTPTSAPLATPAPSITVNVPQSQPQVVYITIPHETVTVTATRAQVKAATPRKRAIHRPCPVTEIQNQCAIHEK
jgi:hypothetical protein